MKSTFKLIINSAFFLMAVFTLSSCNNTHDDSKEVAEEANEEKFDNKMAERNAQLMVDLVSSQYNEIRLARYAMQKSMNTEVKSIAGMLETDHSNFLLKLKELAGQKNVSLPNEDSVAVNNMINDWRDDKPMEFDKEWTNEMIDKHKNSIDKMQNAIDDKDTDPDLKALLNNTLPTVRTHLDQLKACKDKLDNAKS